MKRQKQEKVEDALHRDILATMGLATAMADKGNSLNAVQAVESVALPGEGRALAASAETEPETNDPQMCPDGARVAPGRQYEGGVGDVELPRYDGGVRMFDAEHPPPLTGPPVVASTRPPPSPIVLSDTLAW